MLFLNGWFPGTVYANRLGVLQGQKGHQLISSRAKWELKNEL